MNFVKKNIVLFIILFSINLFSQTSPDYTGGFKINFNESGKKYLRIISWAQVQANFNNSAPNQESKTQFNLRRARILMYAQINDDFLILTHFGLNNLKANNMSPTGLAQESELFFHDVWVEYRLIKELTVGAGLHYFNGISRLNNQSTLNIMTLDNNRQSWSTLGLSDQFVRHLGVFAKGNLGKLQYRVAINDAVVNGLDNRAVMSSNEAIYAGANMLGTKTAGKTYAGYFDYHFLDQESNKLPFKIGTYLGTKKVFNLGFGFFAHPNGAVIADGSNNIIGEDVSIFAFDAFYDTPLSKKGDALTAYAVFQDNNYGTNYLFNAYGTGKMFYTHLGYVFTGDGTKTRYQPYVSYMNHTYDATSNSRSNLGIGINAYFSNNNAKLTLEYRNQNFGSITENLVSLQAMIYL